MKRELTKREKSVLRYIKLGWKNKDIAYILNINEKTVSTYVSRVYDKVGVQRRNNVYRLVTRAIELKII